MAYLDTNTRTVKTPMSDRGQPLGRVNVLNGLYMGFVKKVDDVQYMGRLQVWIPELGSAPDDSNGWITASYCSPFAGATNVDTISKGDIKTFDGTQTSYGMWMVPPDINNQVMIMFINGDASKAIWIGCLYNQFMNNMVPGTPIDTNNYQYPKKTVPVAEYNKWDKRVTNPDQATRPINTTKFKGLGQQGLITDPIRGITDSSARREAPSQVFGVLTPGPAIDPGSSQENIRRKGGHAFIMDDNTNSEYIQLTTKSGAQIRISETDGFVYLINRDGTAWVQMDYQGNIDIFGAGDISMRAQRDLNIRADRNINIEAGQNIFMKAAKDTKEGSTAFTYDVNNNPDLKIIPVWKNVGEGKGDGGDIVMQALNDWQSTTQNNAYLTVKKQNMSIVVQQGLTVTTVVGGQDYASKSGIKHTTEGSFDLSVKGDLRVGSNGTISVTGTGGITLCTPALMSLNADGGMIGNSAGTVNLTGAGGVQIQSTSSPAPASPDAPRSAVSGTTAQIKPLNDKLNILATWSDQDSKFKRDSQTVQVTVSRMPTYEPCPEHDEWSPIGVDGNTPIITPDDATYVGSAGKGNDQSVAPGAATNPGASNTSVTGDGTGANISSKNVPQGALRCQLQRHESLITKSYLDSTGLLHGGIGHLMRTNEIPMYPLGSPISDEQIETWYSQDSLTATKIAQELMGDTWANLSDIRKRAVIDLSFNLGKPRLSKFVKFIAAMKANDWQTAGQELKGTPYAKQVQGRADDIIAMVVNNIDPTGCSGK